MNEEAITQLFGPEYPAVLVRQGERIPLKRETRFCRLYQAPTAIHSISRFMDKSATMTATELKSGWTSWPDQDRRDFCRECGWLSGQADFPEMLRHIIQCDDPEEVSAIASKIAANLPREEAFETLLRFLQNAKPGRAANLSQAIGHTKHPQAESTLRAHVEKIWHRPSRWDDDSFLNWIAFDALTGIEHLIELGVSPDEFETQARQLAVHVCAGNRRACQYRLAKYYKWMKETGESGGGGGS